MLYRRSGYHNSSYTGTSTRVWHTFSEPWTFRASSRCWPNCDHFLQLWGTICLGIDPFFYFHVITADFNYLTFYLNLQSENTPSLLLLWIPKVSELKLLSLLQHNAPNGIYSIVQYAALRRNNKCIHNSTYESVRHVCVGTQKCRTNYDELPGKFWRLNGTADRKNFSEISYT